MEFQEKKSEKQSEIKTYGEQLAEEFGISGFKYAVIQKIVGITPNIYVITLDSKVDKGPIPLKKVRKPKTSEVRLIKKRKPMILSFAPFAMQDTLFMSEVTLTAPVKLLEYKIAIESGAIVFFRDIVGDYHFPKAKYD